MSLQQQLQDAEAALESKGELLSEQARSICELRETTSRLQSEGAAFMQSLVSALSELELRAERVGQVLSDAEPEALSTRAAMNRDSALVCTTSAQLLELGMTIAAQKNHIALLDSNLKEEGCRAAELLARSESNEQRISRLQRVICECVDRAREMTRLSDTSACELGVLDSDLRSVYQSLEEELNCSRSKCKLLSEQVDTTVALLRKAEDKICLFDAQCQDHIRNETELKRQVSEMEGRAQAADAELSSAEANSTLLDSLLSEARSLLSQEQEKAASLKSDLVSLREVLTRTRCIGVNEMQKFRSVSDDLRETVQDLRRDLDMRNAEVSGLISEIKNLRKSLRAAEGHGSEMEEKICTLQEAWRKAQLALTERQAACAVLEEKLEESKASASRFEILFEASELKLQGTKEDLRVLQELARVQQSDFEVALQRHSEIERDLSKENAALLESVMCLTSQTSDLRAEMDKKAAEADSLSIDLTILRAQQEDSAIRESKHVLLREELVQQCADLKGKLLDREEGCSWLEKLVESYKTSSLRLSSELKVCEHRLGNAHAAVHEASKLICVADERASSLNTELETAQFRFVLVQSELNAARLHLQQTEERLQGEVKKREEEMSRLKSDAAGLEAHLAQMLSHALQQVAGLEATALEGRSACEHLVGELREAAEAKALSEGARNAAGLRLQESEASLAALAGRLASCTDELGDREAELANARAELVRLRGDSESERSRMCVLAAGLQCSLDDLQREMLVKARELAAAVAEAAELRGALAERGAQMLTQQNEASLLISSLEQQLSESRESCERLESQMAELSGTLARAASDAQCSAARLCELEAAHLETTRQLSITEQRRQAEESKAEAARVQLMRIQSEAEKEVHGYMDALEELKSALNCARFELEQRELEVMSLTERCNAMAQEVTRSETISVSHARNYDDLRSKFTAMQALNAARSDAACVHISMLRNVLDEATVLSSEAIELALRLAQDIQAHTSRLEISEDSLRATRALLSYVDEQIASRDSEIAAANERLALADRAFQAEQQAHKGALVLHSEARSKHSGMTSTLATQTTSLLSFLEHLHIECQDFGQELCEDERVECQFRALFSKNQDELHEARLAALQLEQEKRDGITALEHVEEQLTRSLEYMQSVIDDRENHVLALQAELKLWKEQNTFQYNAQTFPFTVSELRNLPFQQQQTGLVIESLAAQLEATASSLLKAEAGAGALSSQVLGLQAQLAAATEAVQVRDARSAKEAQVLQGLSPIPTALCATLNEVCRGLVCQSAVLERQRQGEARSEGQLRQMLACLEVSPRSTPTKGVRKIRGMQLELTSARAELDRSRACAREGAAQRQRVGSGLLQLQDLLRDARGETELVRRDLECTQEALALADGARGAERRGLREAAGGATSSVEKYKKVATCGERRQASSSTLVPITLCSQQDTGSWKDLSTLVWAARCNTVHISY